MYTWTNDPPMRDYDIDIIMYKYYCMIMDMKNIISSTEARQNFADVVDKVSNAGARYTLTVNGKAKVVIMNAEEYDSWMETMEIMSDPNTMAAIRQGEKDINEGRYSTLEQVVQDLGLNDEQVKK